MSGTLTLLEVTNQKTPSGIVVEAVGELDLATAPLLQEWLMGDIRATLVEAETAPLSVGLRRVDFIDSMGLALLVAVQKRLAPASFPSPTDARPAARARLGVGPLRCGHGVEL